MFNNDLLTKTLTKVLEEQGKTEEDLVLDQILLSTALTETIRRLNTTEQNAIKRIEQARLIAMWEMYTRFSLAGEYNSFREWFDAEIMAHLGAPADTDELDRARVTNAANIIEYILTWVAQFPDGIEVNGEMVTVETLLYGDGYQYKLRSMVPLFRDQLVSDDQRERMIREIAVGTQGSCSELRNTIRAELSGESPDEYEIVAKKRYLANGDLEYVIRVDEHLAMFLETKLGQRVTYELVNND